MVKWCIALSSCFLILFVSASQAHEKYEALSGWNTEIIKQAETAITDENLNATEMEIIFLMNIVRLQPKLFATSMLRAYLDTTTRNYSKNYLASLINDLQQTKNMQVLRPSLPLTKSAEKHALDMGRSGKKGHVSSSGKTFEERLKPLQKQYVLLGENCHYGCGVALSIVIDLLVDDQIKNLGHRKNILKSDFNCVGVALRPHKEYKLNTVMDFGKVK